MTKTSLAAASAAAVGSGASGSDLVSSAFTGSAVAAGSAGDVFCSGTSGCGGVLGWAPAPGCGTPRCLPRPLARALPPSLAVLPAAPCCTVAKRTARIRSACGWAAAAAAAGTGCVVSTSGLLEELSVPPALPWSKGSRADAFVHARFFRCFCALLTPRVFFFFHSQGFPLFFLGGQVPSCHVPVSAGDNFSSVFTVLPAAGSRLLSVPATPPQPCHGSDLSSSWEGPARLGVASSSASRLLGFPPPKLGVAKTSVGLVRWGPPTRSFEAESFDSSAPFACPNRTWLPGRSGSTRTRVKPKSDRAPR